MTKKQARFLSLILIAVFLASGALHSNTAAEKEAEIDAIINTQTDASLVQSPFTDVVGAVSQSVVGVNNYQMQRTSARRGFGSSGRGESREQLYATGSGVVIYDKYVLTNYHVVQGASRLSIFAAGAQEETDAALAAYDEAADLAVLYAKDLETAAVPLGDSDRLQVGEWAVCIGNPISEELRGTITVGIVSALDREIASYETTDRYGLKTTVFNRMIQTDAAINSGNSGGGLFNTLGQLMGIPTMKYSGSRYSGAAVEGIGLAIPINSAKPIIQKAIGDQLTDEAFNMNTDSDDASAPSGVRLGVTVSLITNQNNEAVYYGYLPSGLMIAQIDKGSPAEKGGLLADDVIVEADGNIITNVQTLSGIVQGKSAGDTLTVKVYRAENLAEAERAEEIRGEYMEFEIEMFAY